MSPLTTSIVLRGMAKTYPTNNDFSGNSAAYLDTFVHHLLNDKQINEHMTHLSVKLCYFTSIPMRMLNWKCECCAGYQASVLCNAVKERKKNTSKKCS